MLEIRPNCENCNKDLPFDSTEAMICTFECTFCENCVEKLHRMCLNCGGDFTKRPIRPKGLLEKYPPFKKRVYKPVDMETHLKNIRQKS